MTFRSTEWEHDCLGTAKMQISAHCMLTLLSVEKLEMCHLRQHHTDVLISVTRQKQTGRRVFLPTVFRQPLTADLDSAKVRTNSVGMFIAAKFQPY